jgi:hypothetical protein
LGALRLYAWFKSEPHTVRPANRSGLGALHFYALFEGYKIPKLGIP